MIFHTRKEGEAMRNGFNNYPKDDERHGGGVFRLGNFAFWYRYSKTFKRWHVGPAFA